MRIRKHRQQSSIWQRWIGLYKNKNTQKFSWFSFVWKNTVFGFIALVLLSFMYGWIFLPSVHDADQLIFAESTIIYDRGALDPDANPDDHILYVIHGDENREYIPLSEISPHAIDALVAIEDDQFYGHFGFDIGGLIKAVLSEFGIGPKRGGSTITQQLVKNTFLTNEQTYLRKYNELLLAIKMEMAYSKEEILEQYFNKVGYGSNSYGIEAASKTFFGKSAKELDILEGAILAALVNRPSTYSPYGPNRDILMGYYKEDEETGTSEYIKGRKDLVLGRMLDLNMITFDEFSDSHTQAKTFEFTRARADIKAPHFVFYVQEQIEKKFGKEFLQSGGLRIYTTIDRELQTIAEETITQLSEFYESSHGATNVALASLNPDNGQIMAFVGGKDFFNQEIDGQVNVLTSRRQPGSSFKPVTYAAAFAAGYSPSTILFDVETDFGGNYKPQNYDGEFYGPVSAREALNRSLNIPAVKMAHLATPAKVISMAEQLGVTLEGTAWDHGVAIGLGVAEVSPLEHIASYQAFARDGSYFVPSSILEVRNSEGKVLEKLDISRNKKEGIDPEIAGLIRNVLNDETARPTTNGFNWNTFLQLDGYDNGAKTGTSNRMVTNPNFNPEEPEDEEDNPKMVRAPGDAWTVGYTPYLVAGVWAGNNRGEPMKFSGTGMTLAAPIWKRFMTKAHQVMMEQGAEKDKQYPDVGLQTRQINRFSGMLAGPETPEGLLKQEVFASFNTPTDLDNSVKIVRMDKTTGQLATRLSNPRNVIEKIFIEMHSVLNNKETWEQPVQEWIKENPNALTQWDIILSDTLPKEEQELVPPNAREIGESRPPRRSNIPDRYGLTSSDIKVAFAAQKNNSTVAPGVLEVPLSLQSRNNIVSAEYYLNDVLVQSVANAPWSGTITIPEGAESVQMKVIVQDISGKQGEIVVDLNIAEDTEGPDITFLGPVGRQQIPLNSSVEILVEAFDAGSGVKSVDIYLDDTLLGSDNVAPYTAKFNATGSLGGRKLIAKATDKHGNTEERMIPIFFEREKLISGNNPSIANITSYQRSVSVDVVLPKLDNIERAEIIVEQKGTIVYRQVLAPPRNFQQFQIPRTYQGDAVVVLRIGYQGTQKLENAATEFFDL